MKPPTKTARIEQAREIIDRNVLDVPFSETDLQEFVNVTGMQHITGAIRRINPTYPRADPRHVRFIIDGVETAASWRKAIEGKNPKADLQRALRVAVAPCLREFKDDTEEQGCANCGSTENLQVDHVWPPFQTISEEFIAHKLGQIELKNEENGIGWVIADIDVETEWIAFHAARAQYQILCRSCNASKGNTKAVRRSYA